ncbi:ParA family protein [Aestuariibacter salexigens]|uniref:ParA family protein n=1 Tax=Aestuariibacter salexigens TaxID=226010 RepID=UPI0003FCFDDB|nr:ParA family protein [Aestuariibacter salexigens]
MKRVVFNQKGGVGKSSISVNLAAISARRGLKTLIVDLDTQGNTSHYLVGDNANIKHTVADLFKQTVGWFLKPLPAIDFVHETPFENLYLMASDPQLANVERELESRYKMYKLKEALTELSATFDRIYIDTPPNFNFYSKAALIAADSVLIPFDCDGFSSQAIMHLLDNIMELKGDHNPELEVEGIIVNQFNAQAKLPQSLVDDLKAKDLPVLNTHLSSSVKMRESHSASKPLIHLAPRHKLTQQFCELFDELEQLS